MDRKKFDRQLDTLSVFAEINCDPIFHAFRQCFYENEKSETIFAAANFAGALYNLAHTENWTAYLKNLVFSLENACSYFAAKKQEIPENIRSAAVHDLQLLSICAELSAKTITEGENPENLFFPEWKTESCDLTKLYFERLAEIEKHGYGIFAKYRMFHLECSDSAEKGYVLEPVAFPDKVNLQDLIDYELQRKKVIDNTKALLSGKKASNILLYGDAGTGKSATVKAVANAYAEQGLRLIELSKNELHLLPKLLEELNANPLKFILFIDDLSFQENDDDFSALKAVLEGSISARAYNTVIYATSNRRHIVRETFSQRAGDEIHRNDTMQETISLSERFGIQILFNKPNKDTYLHIVSHLAEEAGLTTNQEEILLQAEQFAMRKSGRSARSARQFIEQLHCAEELKEESNC